MGSGIALSFALKGFEVILFDSFAPVLEKAKEMYDFLKEGVEDKKVLAELKDYCLRKTISGFNQFQLEENNTFLSTVQAIHDFMIAE